MSETRHENITGSANLPHEPAKVLGEIAMNNDEQPNIDKQPVLAGAASYIVDGITVYLPTYNVSICFTLPNGSKKTKLSLRKRPSNNEGSDNG